MIQHVPLTPYDYVTARLQEFVGRRTPWSRRLWSVGSITELREALEAAELFSDGHLRQKSMGEVIQAARNAACADPGVGDAAFRDELRRILDGGLRTQRERNRLAYMVDRSASGYLERWAAAMPVAAPTQLEAAARSIASHMLDGGFSMAHLRAWLRATLEDTSTLADLLTAAQAQLVKDPHPYEVLVPFSQLSLEAGMELPHGWLDAPAAAAWLKDNGNAGIRQVGAFVVSTRARDPWSAVGVAADQLARVMARITVGTPIGTLRADPMGMAFVRGKDRGFELAGQLSELEVHALARQSAVLSLDNDQRVRGIDFAIELAAPLARQVSPYTLPAAWAALEALLGSPDEGAHTAAAAAGAILAGSWPRAELTTLAYADPAGSAALSAGLVAASSNRERCRLLSEAIKTEPALSFAAANHACSLERMRQVQASPAAVLGRVNGYLEQAFLRLYRQRNHLMHAGQRRSVALEPTLRTTPSLVGAVLDRVVHAHVSEGLSPGGLTARAITELQLVGTPGGRSHHELLERV